MSQSENTLQGRWALILGASSGFGAAISRALAHEGMNILGVHLDPRSTLDRAQAVVRILRQVARTRCSLIQMPQIPAGAPVSSLKSMMCWWMIPQQTIHLLVHTLAFGSLRPYISDEMENETSEEQMEMTFRVMAHSLVYWTQDLVRAKLLGSGSRIYSMSSIGSQRATASYGAVSAAKAALEAHTRQLALELAPMGITANCLMPGVTDTPALRMIPGHEKIIQQVLASHPAKRLTTPEDVAQVIVALADPRVKWVSGAVIPVDGGEGAISIG